MQKCYSANKLTKDKAFIDEDEFYNEGTRRGLANDRIANLPADQQSAARLRERERIERWVGDQAAADNKADASTVTLPTDGDAGTTTLAIDMATNSAASFAANTSVRPQDEAKAQKRSFATKLKSLFKHKTPVQQTSLPTVVTLTQQRYY